MGTSNLEQSLRLIITSNIVRRPMTNHSRKGRSGAHVTHFALATLDMETFRHGMLTAVISLSVVTKARRQCRFVDRTSCDGRRPSTLNVHILSTTDSRRSVLTTVGDDGGKCCEQSTTTVTC